MKTAWTIVLFTVLFVLNSCTEEFGGSGNPDDDNVQKYLGTWNVSDQPARLNYTVNIQRNPSNSDQVIMYNFADLGGQAIGLVVNNNMVIDLQNIGGDYMSEGSGNYINSKQLYFEFFLDDGIDKELRRATFTK